MDQSTNQPNQEKKIIFGIIVILLVVYLGVMIYYFLTAKQSGEKAVKPTASTEQVVGQSSVAISNFSFQPAEITIKAGTTVTWTNNDAVSHQIAADSFNSEALGNGASFSHQFGSAGTFDYHCSIHPSMKGRVTVTQ